MSTGRNAIGQARVINYARKHACRGQVLAWENTAWRKKQWGGERALNLDTYQKYLSSTHTDTHTRHVRAGFPPRFSGVLDGEGVGGPKNSVGLASLPEKPVPGVHTADPVHGTRVRPV